jgi:HD-GYP domain-containing protein (c-di-GMP phosphodiesterase class II)
MRTYRKSHEFHARKADDPSEMLAEQLVGDARERRKRCMESRERRVDSVSAALFLIVAIALAKFLPSERHADPWLISTLVLAYALVGQVRFEFGEAFNSPVQLVFVAALVLLPLNLIPLLTVTAMVLALVPEINKGRWHHERTITTIAEAWFSVGPVLVLAALAPGQPDLGDAPVYALAFAAQLACDLIWGLIRDVPVLGLSPKQILRTTAGVFQVDAILGPIAFVISIEAIEEPAVLIAMAPLVWLLQFFSRDRTERYTASLELNRAYRGTVMLLADVIEFDDTNTGNHSRSVVELVRAVSEEMGIDSTARQELEFAALLHDVGKIGIPKEILNKPSKLSPEEFEIMKTHTIEGQFMLDRIGGLLGRVGEIVRSCHERWDGKGYPDGLRGEEIPVEARIVFVCDAFSAMTTDRPYRPATSWEEALIELRRNAGTQFDPTVVAAFARVVGALQPELPATAQVRAILSAAVPADTASPARTAS